VRLVGPDPLQQRRVLRLPGADARQLAVLLARLLRVHQLAVVPAVAGPDAQASHRRPVGELDAQRGLLRAGPVVGEGAADPVARHPVDHLDLDRVRDLDERLGAGDREPVRVGDQARGQRPEQGEDDAAALHRGPDSSPRAKFPSLAQRPDPRVRGRSGSRPEQRHPQRRRQPDRVLDRRRRQTRRVPAGQRVAARGGRPSAARSGSPAPPAPAAAPASSSAPPSAADTPRTPPARRGPRGDRGRSGPGRRRPRPARARGGPPRGRSSRRASAPATARAGCAARAGGRAAPPTRRPAARGRDGSRRRAAPRGAAPARRRPRRAARPPARSRCARA
jgi:hypothetical protein